MRYLFAALTMLLWPVIAAQAQIGVNIEISGVNIGIGMPAYPQLVRVPGYPVYYAPQANSNYFFYDGLYWVYQSDNWYSSSWYNGPWELVEAENVPLYLLRVPVRYYRQPPVYFHGWSADAPPRWGEHWGNDWEKAHAGWDQWDHRSAPAPAPLPSYQRQYSGARYPSAPAQQVQIRDRNYHYQPREAVTQQHFQRPVAAPQQAPAQPRTQAPQQHSQQGEPRQQPQAPQPNPAQHAQPKPPVQTQARQPPAQAQRGQSAPQGKGHENKAAPRSNEPENKVAPHGNGQENKAAPQGNRQENKEAPQGNRPENKEAPRPGGQENKAEERGPGH